jgi:DNA topoisomerase-1
VDRLLNSEQLSANAAANASANATNANATNANAKTKNLCRLLGKYNGSDLFLRSGKYGPYLTWGDHKKSLPHLKSLEDANAITDVDDLPCAYDDAVRRIESSSSSSSSSTTNAADPKNPNANPSILREINASTSVRTGQYGPYIYYKNPKMITPAFVSLRGFKEDWKTCDLRMLEMWSTTTPVKKKN